jgi:hypothetical protein
VLTNNGAGSFTTAATLAVGTNPVCVAAADINGDGRVDLVSANELGKTVTVLTNNGLGGFGSNATLHLSGNPTALVLADLTGDGKPDLAVTVASLISSIQVFTNNGSGRFGSNTTIFLPPQGSIVAAGVNGSGRNALITANATGNQLTVLTPTGPGRPLLRISRPAAHSFVLSWVSAQTNFVLQTNNNLASTNWFPGNYPVSINGSNQSSTLTAPPPGRLFFRLAQ